MGYKCSMIIVQKPAVKTTDADLLQALNIPDFSYASETTLEESIYPRDKSFTIGEFNNCTIICDDYLLTTTLETSKTPQSLSDYEKSLTELFPGSEILTVACHSGVNYRMYSLVKNGQKIRFKKVTDGEPLIEYGERLEEENHVYKYSKIVNGQLMFRSAYTDGEGYEYTEDQMMEDFTFGVAARHLGVKISTDDDEILMMDTPFRKYIKQPTAKPPVVTSEKVDDPQKPKGSWWSRLFK